MQLRHLCILPLAPALLLASCGRGGSARDARTPSALAIGGTSRTGDASLLSWNPVKGATTYGVTVVGEEGTRGFWAWSGSDTRVQYGIAELNGLSEEGIFIPVSAEPRRVRSLQPGGHYRWLVLAFDSAGKVVGVSDIQHFVAPTPAPPPKPTSDDKAAALGAGFGGPNLRNPCDIITAEQMRGILGHDPGAITRRGPSCNYGGIALILGPAAAYDVGKQMLAGAKLKDLKGFGDASYVFDMWGAGVQLAVRAGDVSASVTVIDSTITPARQLEIARKLAATLLDGSR